MPVTKTYEPVRPFYAPDEHSVFYYVGVFGVERVVYGESEWPSRCYWTVPGTDREMGEK